TLSWRSRHRWRHPLCDHSAAFGEPLFSGAKSGIRMRIQIPVLDSVSGNLFTIGSRCAVLIAFVLAATCDLHAQQVVPSVEWERLYARLLGSGYGTDDACAFDQVIEEPGQGYVLSGHYVGEVTGFVSD